MIKRVICLLLTAVAWLCADTAQAQEFTVGDWTYKFNEWSDEWMVTKYHGSAKRIEIPQTVTYLNETMDVTRLGENIFESAYKYSGATIYIHPKIKSIEGFAFSGDVKVYPSNVSEEEANEYDVILPSTVETVNGGLFAGNQIIKKVKLDNVHGLTWDMFFKCKSLKQVDVSYWGYNVPSSVFEESNIPNLDIPSSVESIGQSAFSNCHWLTEVTGCAGVEKIGKKAFYGSQLFSGMPYMPELKEIESSAFYGTGLKKIILGPCLPSINEYAFSSCKFLVEIVSLNPLPPKIDQSVFEGCNTYYIDVHVPTGSIEAYRNHPVWNQFIYFYEDAEEKLAEYLAAGVDDVVKKDVDVSVSSDGATLCNADGKTVAIYDLTGRERFSSGCYGGEHIRLDKGVYILLVDGKAVKIKI